MNPPEQTIEDAENGVAKNKMEAGKNYDATIGKDAVVEEGEKKERDPRHNDEQEMIQKAVAFWNHPALQDVPSSEKRLYLHEQQSLTNSQIHKVWEEIVESPRVGMDNNNIHNRPAMPPQQYSAHLQPPQSQRYYNHQSSSHPHTNASYGQYFNSNQAPQSHSQASNHAHDYQHNNSGSFPPLPNDIMEGGADGSISVARGVSLLGVGGALGVTGAAAMRWLNGGRFELFPTSATTVTTASISRDLNTKIASDEQELQGKVSVTQQEMSKHGQAKKGEYSNDGTKWNNNRDNNNNLDNEYEYEYDEVDQYDDAEYSDNNDEKFNVEECLLERMDALLSSIGSNSALQEKVILKLANTSTITDDSMSLLKQKSQSDNKASDTIDIPLRNSKTLEQLKEVKDGMANLCESMTNALSSDNYHANGKKDDWEQEWSKLLARFDDCIQTLKKPVDSFAVDADAADSKSISTSETTQTEIQGRQDIQLFPPAPSTPADGTSNGSRISYSDMMETLIPLSLNDCIRKLAEKNSPLSLKSGSQLLYLYLANLSGKPDNRRYRKIFTSNESFRKVENLAGGKDLLYAVGFVDESDKGVLEWVPTGSTEEEISALILVKDAAAALGVLKKSDNVPSSELVRSALSKLSASSLSFPVPPSPSNENKNKNKSGNHIHRSRDQEEIPQTPVGSSLLSPPMPKKIPFIPTPSDNLK